MIRKSLRFTYNKFNFFVSFNSYTYFDNRLVAEFIVALFKIYRKLYFAYLEINPLGKTINLEKSLNFYVFIRY